MIWPFESVCGLAGRSVNAKSCGETSFIEAIFNGNAEIVKLLLRYGASLKITDTEENIPLECALNELNINKLDLVKVIVFHQHDLIM